MSLFWLRFYIRLRKLFLLFHYQQPKLGDQLLGELLKLLKLHEVDIHEAPYLVGGDKTALTPGMCFSNEPTICIPGEFGVRLEDHFYISDTGPKWFTSPSPSIDDPFGLDDST